MVVRRFARSFLPYWLALSAGTVHAQVGAVTRSQKINDVSGGFTGVLSDDGYFGWSLAALGDLNGDGVPDLAVSNHQDDDGGPDRGALWILFLDATGHVSASQKISQTQGGFAGALSDGALFGRELAALGDLDGDGRSELVATAGGPNRLWVLFLNADGTVRSQRELLFSAPAFQPPTFPRTFNDGGMASVGDTDGDGIGDLVLGAPLDDDGPGFDVGALWILRLNADGSAKSTQKISQTEGGFTGALTVEEHFGERLGVVGDLDGDGNVELGVAGDPFQTWLLFLDANEHVRETHEIDIGGGLLRALGRLGVFYNTDWTGIGDLDGDGFAEVALATPGHRNAQGIYTGAVTVGSFRADGTMLKGVLLSSDHGGLGPLPADTYFGRGIAPLGDLDGDGTTELAVGAVADSDAGSDRGAVWILFPRGSAVRNGAGGNPLALTQLAEPTLGGTWTTTLDCSAHASGLALLLGSDRPLAGVFLPQGELLIDSSAVRLFHSILPHTGGTATFQQAVPNSFGLLNLQLFVQGLSTGAPGARLSNALDVVVGY
ncbi:MAG: hypothetical protein EXS08_06620 [Planctomycetes bacterium]|nr:hypothetical protein [Planctomycetota bacterium]